MHIAGPTIARPGSIDSRGSRDAERAALVLDDLGHLDRQLRGVGRVVLGRVGDAEAAAEVELGHRHAELGADLGVQGEHPTGGHLEARGVEDLAADVGVQAEQLQARGGDHTAYGLEGVAGGDREAELLVLVGGGDVLVGVGLDARPSPAPSPAGVRPRLAVTRSSRSISSNESTTIRPTPSATARVSSTSVLVLPW